MTVASATLRATGVQSSLLEELIRLSIAPFRMSIPEVEAKKKKTHGTVNHWAENVPAKHERKEMTKDTSGVHVKPAAA